jgi:hypothetical protein
MNANLRHRNDEELIFATATMVFEIFLSNLILLQMTTFRQLPNASNLATGQ